LGQGSAPTGSTTEKLYRYNILSWSMYKG